ALRQRGQLMDDVGRPRSGDGRLERGGIERVGDRRDRSEVAQPSLLLRRARQRRHLMSGAYQRLNERDSNRTGSAGDEDSHDDLAMWTADQIATADPQSSVSASRTAVTPNI